MARPRKTTEEQWYDLFADWPLEDQAAALKVLNELHRQKYRETKRLPAPPMLERRNPQTGLWPGEQSLTVDDLPTAATRLPDHEGGQG